MPAVERTRFTELIWRMHRSLFRASGGRIGARLGALPVLLLTVRGRKSGVGRDVVLNYVRDGECYVVFASHAGEDRDPPWWLNLRDAGEAEVMLEGERFRVRAREAEGAERERLWSEVKQRDDAYAEYEKRTARRIAVVVLDRDKGSRP
jgi:deazaflavin-dependent oxidoreductase (nitroreductase family)